jgi:hypothetical protein
MRLLQPAEEGFAKSVIFSESSYVTLLMQDKTLAKKN